MIWPVDIRRFRERKGLTQTQLGLAIGVAQRTISRWERGEDRPSPAMQRKLRDLGWSPPTELLALMQLSVQHCPSPRALSLLPKLKLLAVSPAAIAKRPTISNWIDRDLAPIATGVLAEMLADKPLQRAIARGEVAAVMAVTESVLKTGDPGRIGRWQTTITYFRHDGAVYSDAQSSPATAGAGLGYTVITMDSPAAGGR